MLVLLIKFMEKSSPLKEISSVTLEKNQLELVLKLSHGTSQL
jgi:hypothetical protein